MPDSIPYAPFDGAGIAAMRPTEPPWCCPVNAFPLLYVRFVVGAHGRNATRSNRLQTPADHDRASRGSA
jgi:hypothetical protein